MKPKWKKDDNLGHKISGYLCKTQFFCSPLDTCSFDCPANAVFCFKLPQFFDSSSCRGTHYQLCICNTICDILSIGFYQPLQRHSHWMGWSVLVLLGTFSFGWNAGGGGWDIQVLLYFSALQISEIISFRIFKIFQIFQTFFSNVGPALFLCMANLKTLTEIV